MECVLFFFLLELFGILFVKAVDALAKVWEIGECKK